MKLIIDTRNGISGDICCAGLIGLGANRDRIVQAMEKAGMMIGMIEITHHLENDIHRLDMILKTDIPSLSGSQTHIYLQRSLENHKLSPVRHEQAHAILDTLCRAEKKVHEKDPRLQHMVTHHHNHRSSDDALLHEAQDILVDITGAICGLMDLEITEVHYFDHVNVGNGTIRFSHGTFHVPVPAVREILTTSGIEWRSSDRYEQEMSTPTGVSILAGLNAERVGKLEVSGIVRSSKARGSRQGLPPVEFHLVR